MVLWCAPSPRPPRSRRVSHSATCGAAGTRAPRGRPATIPAPLDGRLRQAAGPRARLRRTSRLRPGAALTLGLPVTWVVALSQVSATPIRGLLLAAGTLTFAWVIDRPDDRPDGHSGRDDATRPLETV